MNSQYDENLEELLGRFLDGKQAKDAAGDISKGEQILRRHPAPVPDDVLLADIKGKIAKALSESEKKANTFKGAVYRVTAVAAAFIILATISVKLFEKSPVASITPQTVWESVDGAAEDAEWAVFTARTEQIESDALSLKSYENGVYEKEITEMESDLTEMDSDFWKG
jgi:hypothetical protein